MSFGHGPWSHTPLGHAGGAINIIKGLFVKAYKAVLDFNKPSIPRGYKATVV